MRMFTWISAVTLVVMSATAARAGDEAKADALLRQAEVSARVERQLDEALALYRQAATTSEQGPVARQALLAMAQIHEQRGEVSIALEVLQELVEKQGDRLDEAQKLAVHEAMVRLLPPGSRARSPLAEIVVRTPAQANTTPLASSPLDRKIEDLLSQLDGIDGLDWNAQNNLRSNLRKSLDPVGKEALPIFARLLRGSRPERARFAATLYAEHGQADAVEGLASAIREGDGFTRDAALGALGTLNRTEGISPRVMAALPSLQALSSLSKSQRASVQYLEYKHIPAEEALHRHLEQDGEGLEWLRVALRLAAPGAVERVLEIAKGSDARASEALLWLLPMIFPADNAAKPVYDMETLPAGLLDRILAALTTAPLPGDQRTAQAIAQLVVALGARSGPTAGEGAALQAWRKFLTTEHTERAKQLGVALIKAQVRPPQALLEDPAWVARYVLRLHSAQPELFQLAQQTAFWRSLIAALSSASEGERSTLLHYTLNQKMDPPRELDQEWFAVLDLPPFDVPSNGVSPNALNVTARTGDARHADLVRRYVLGCNWQGQSTGSALSSLRLYDSPLRLPLIEELLNHPSTPQLWIAILLQHLHEAGEPGRSVLVRYAQNETHQWSVTALSRLNSAADAEVIQAICERFAEIPGLTEVNVSYRQALMGRAVQFHLLAAFPYLLREYQEGLSAPAGEALEQIRTYHERLASYRAWAQGAESAPGKAVMDLLSDSDAEIRRAAAQTLGAMGARNALPALTRMAKEDADPRVRAAALQAVERLAR